ncbi:MAG TPA: SPOR domain-containing protein [Steroidobacteraceae bacterium]|nr:SPOR domain-containing protein [Steroidobacteraceae bacterium]
MITIRAGKGVLAVGLLLLGACSREQQDWRSAEAADSVEAYGDFIQRHPDSELVTQARARVVQLGEDRDWQEAGSTDTSQAYRQFLAQHPNGKWAQEARIRIENFALGTQPSDGSTGTAVVPVPPAAAAAAAPAAAAPAVPPAMTSAAPAQPMPAATSPPAKGYGVQLGAFSSDSGANAAWQALQGRFAAELKGLSPQLVGADTPSGRVYRLQASVSDEAHARALCDALKARSQPCVPVLPH